MNDLYDYFKVLFNAQKIGHAFLIGNTCLDNCKDILEKVLSDFFFEKKITIDNNVDIICITPEGNAISKAQVKSLVNDLSTTSQYSGIKVYIIDGADKLTDNVYNALLKTIEEPANNIYAFLISSNINAVGETIKSRCQCIFTSSFDASSIDDNTKNIAKDFIVQIEKYKYNCYGKYSKIYKIIDNKNMLKDLVFEMYEIYLNLLYNKVGIECNLDVDFINELPILDLTSICEKVIFINSIIEKNTININKDLLIDEIIYGLGGLCNETSIC